ncbi:MAG: glucose-6-phosphate isomerase [Dehalococcoidales bacterium]|nr:glucose-6-phosphate isomerase [Dehalococcoidales bacterium]
MPRCKDIDLVKGMDIRLDYSQMMSEFIGDKCGITEKDIASVVPQADKIIKTIARERKNNKLGFYNLPSDMESADKIRELADSLRQNCDDLVVLGIGGSALGGKALFNALCHPLHNLLPKNKRKAPRVFFLDNIDPVMCQAVFGIVNPEKTVTAVVSKSGTTVETISQFLIFRDILERRTGKSASAEKTIVITDDNANPLRTLARKSGYHFLPVPANVGGRYSVLSPVGLFPAAMLDIDIFELMAGARYMAEKCKADNFRQNPAYMAGIIHYIADTKKGLHIAVTMPYCDGLKETAFWFRQIWAESLGKEKDLNGKTVNAGQTPIAALGATDQHSQLQLYAEGPYDKMVTFWVVEKPGVKVMIPKIREKEFTYLGGNTLGGLVNIEAQATQLALTEAGRSSMSLTLPEINPFTIGQLLFLLELQTYFTGGLYNINPLDQPGVEAGKRYTKGLLGKPGLKNKADILNNWQNKIKSFTIKTNNS